MPEFHFVDDYKAHVADLKKHHPIDKAMELAIGGSFKEVGNAFSDLLILEGLRSGHDIIDFGCGSGRVALPLSRKVDVRYHGIDVVPDLVDYAASVCPADYRFSINNSLGVPAASSSADYLCAFSVFTHLLHEESFLYFEEIARVLRPNGSFIFSFLEHAIPSHWAAFKQIAQHRREGSDPNLTTFMDRNQIERMAGRAGLRLARTYDGDKPSAAHIPPIGESVAVLEKLDCERVAEV